MQNYQRVPPTSCSPLEDRSFESLYPPPGSSPGVGSSPESSSPSLSLTREEGDQPASPSKKYPDYCRTLQVRDSNGAVKELVFPKALDLDRPKRARTTFSAEQLYKLEREFLRNQYLVGRERTDLAHNLQLSETQVKVWFQNRRTKYKRDNCRQAEERKQHAEGMAACNIMRMLQQKPPAPPGSTPAPPRPPGPAPPRPPGPTPTSLPPTSLPPIPIAVSISNRPPLGSNVNPSLLQGHSPLQAPHPSSRFHFPPPPHMAHMHNFAAGFYTS